MNKTVLVTGASRGIGLAIAKKYADQGFNVAFTYVSENPKINETVEKVKGGNDIKVVAYQLNVTSVEQCEEVLAKIYEEFETIDVLVNNAGITKDMLSLKMKSEDFFAVVNTNLGGTFNISQFYPLNFSICFVVLNFNYSSRGFHSNFSRNFWLY